MGSIREITLGEMNLVYPLFQELRPHINQDQFFEIYNQAQMSNNYTFYGYFEEDICIGLMGLRYLHDYVHLFHLYIDDLVVSASYQSQGIGAKLLKFAEELAVQKKCNGLRLCTGVENERGINFYKRENWVQRAFAFKKQVKK